MSITSDITDILARTDLTDEEKRSAIYALKSGAVAIVAESLVGQNINLGEGYRVEITRAPSFTEKMDLALWFTATKNGKSIPFDAPLIIRNIPVIHQGNEDPLSALQEVVLTALRRTG
jgi:hypothetical protein